MKILNSILAIVFGVVLLSSCDKDDPINTSIDTLDFLVSPENPFVDTETKFTVNDPYRFDYYEYVISSPQLEKDSIIQDYVANYKFETEGEYTITLNIKKDGKLEKVKDHSMTLVVNKYLAPKTLYFSTAGETFTDVQGELYSADLSSIDTLIKEPLEVSCGQNTFNIQWADDKLYYFSAGDRKGYSANDPKYETNVGFIKSFDPLLYYTYVHMAFSNEAYDDPFAGFVSGGNIYWANRNFLVAKTPSDTKNKIFPGYASPGKSLGSSNQPFNEEGVLAEWYYGVAVGNPLHRTSNGADSVMTSGVGYHGQIENIDGVWWISKYHKDLVDNGQSGIWKIVKDAETAQKVIDARPDAFDVAHDYVYLGQKNPLEKSQILGDYLINKFAVTADKIFFTCTDNNGKSKKTPGVYMSDITGNNVIQIEEFKEDETYYYESVGHFSDIVIDEDSNKVYWTYTNNDYLNPGGFSGIKSYDMVSKTIKEEIPVDKPLAIEVAPAYIE